MTQEQIIKATLEDAAGIRKLVNYFASKNVMLPRSLTEIYENIRDFWVVRKEDEIIACCALHPLWENLAEIKSLAVSEKHQKEGLARMLIEKCIEEAVLIKAAEVFALTYTPGFFEKLGFEKGDKEKMPHKIWSECIKCPLFPDCDEELMVRYL